MPHVQEVGHLKALCRSPVANSAGDDSEAGSLATVEQLTGTSGLMLTERGGRATAGKQCQNCGRRHGSQGRCPAAGLSTMEQMTGTSALMVIRRGSRARRNTTQQYELRVQA